MIKNILKRREESDTYLIPVCKHRRSRQIKTKMDETGAFSKHCGFLQLMKTTDLAESSSFIHFHRGLSSPAMCTDMSQVGIFFNNTLYNFLK